MRKWSAFGKAEKIKISKSRPEASGDLRGALGGTGVGPKKHKKSRFFKVSGTLQNPTRIEKIDDNIDVKSEIEKMIKKVQQQVPSNGYGFS